MLCLVKHQKKIFFIYLAVKRYHKFRKMARNFADFGVFLRLTMIHLYNFGMLNFRWIFYALSNNKKKKSQVAQSKEIQLLGKTYEIFAFFGRFSPQRSEELDVCFQTRIFK